MFSANPRKSAFIGCDRTDFACYWVLQKLFPVSGHLLHVWEMLWFLQVYVESLYRNPWSKVVMEKLTVSKIVMKLPYPNFYFFGGRRGIGNECTWSCSQSTPLVPSPSQKTLTHALSYYLFKPNITVILQLMPGCSNCCQFFRFTQQDLLRISLLPFTCHVPLSSQLNSFDDLNRISSLSNILEDPANSSSLGSIILRQHLTRKYQMFAKAGEHPEFSH